MRGVYRGTKHVPRHAGRRRPARSYSDLNCRAGKTRAILAAQMALSYSQITGATLACGLLCLTACRGPDLAFDCDTQRSNFDEIVEMEGILLDEIGEGGPYPVSMVFSQEGINTLLQATVDQDLPFQGEVQFLAGTIEFEPKALPELQLMDAPGCLNCVRLDVEFDLVYSQGEDAISSGIGRAEISFPLELEQKDDGSSALIADYSKTIVEDLELTIFGFSFEEEMALGGAISILINEAIVEQFGRTELIAFGTWAIGSGAIELAARQLFIDRENETLSIALQSNLALPAGSGLGQDTSVPDGIKLAVKFDPKLILAMSQRMMVEGEIPRFYDQDGDPVDEGEFGATIESIEPDIEADDPELSTRFRVWRLEGGLCGYAVAEMPLFLQVDESGDLGVEPGGFTVVSGEGSGSVAARDDELVDENRDLVNNFRDALAEQVGLTIDYDSLDVPGRVIIFDTLAIDVDVDSVETFLDFLVVQAP